MISAGAKNRKVTIQTVAVTQPKGEVTKTPSSAGQRYARRQAQSTRESFVSDQRYAEADYVFEFRSDTVTRAIDATYLLVDDGVTYEVVGAIDPDGVNREVQVFATRKDT